MPDKAVTLIDLDRIVRSRAGAKAKYIPGFVVGWLKRLIHQDFINEYLKRGYVGVEFCENTLRYLDVTVKVEGLENVSDLSKRYTFVSNHPLGAIDGVTLGMVLGRHYDGKIKYLVNDLLMNLEGLAPLCVPINKLGAQARNFPQLVDDGGDGVAGDGHRLYLLLLQEVQALPGQVDDLLLRAVAVWLILSVPVEDDGFPRQDPLQLLHYGKAAQAGVHYANGPCVVLHDNTPDSTSMRQASVSSNISSLLIIVNSYQKIL